MSGPVCAAAHPSFRSRSNAAEQGAPSFLQRMEESGSNLRYSPSGLPVGQLSGKYQLPGEHRRIPLYRCAHAGTMESCRLVTAHDTRRAEEVHSLEREQVAMHGNPAKSQPQLKQQHDVQAFVLAARTYGQLADHRTALCDCAGSAGSLASQLSMKIPSAHLNPLKAPMHYASMGSGGHARADGIPRAQTWATDITSSTRTTAVSPLRGTASVMTWGSGEGGRPMTAGARKAEARANNKLA